jgi:hypothetical protein
MNRAATTTNQNNESKKKILRIEIVLTTMN